MIYMLVYLVMNLGAFLVVIVVAQATGSESILDSRGLARRPPLAAVAFAIFLFSLTGLPPFAGFIGKWYLFYAVLERIAGPGGSWYVRARDRRRAEQRGVALLLRADRAGDVPRRAAQRDGRSSRASGTSSCSARFSALVLVFGLWWKPIVTWSQASLAMLRL